MYPSRLSQHRLFALPLLCRWQGSCLGPMFASLWVIGLLLWATVGLAQAPLVQAPAPASRPHPRAERLSQDLVALSMRHQLAAPAEQAQLLRDLLTVASERQQLLAALIADDPGEVLRVALPAELRASLPAAVQALVEEEIEVEGALEVLVEDRDVGSRYLYVLKTAGQRFSLYFAVTPPTNLLTGSQVRVKGVRVDGALVLISSSTSVETLAAAALPNTFGAQNTVVLLVNFQDKPTEQPWTLDQARSLVFGTVSDFFSENSFQQTWLAGEVYGWYTLPIDSTAVCNQYTIESEAKKAATAAGVDLIAYTSLVYVFPGNSCSWTGFATMGGTPSRAWINGDFRLIIVGHELGHNFGLFHSHGLNCSPGTLGSECSQLTYGDNLDIMGNRPGHFNSFQKERLGWLNDGVSPLIATVEAGGTYALKPYEPDGTSPKALKILKGIDPVTGQKRWYYVEYRQASGFDDFILHDPYIHSDNVLNGVVIRSGTEGDGDSSFLLDMTPDSITSGSLFRDLDDPALVVGESYTDSEAGITITTEWADANGASVSVSFSRPSCVHANPSLALSPSESQGVAPGTSVTYTVTVANNDDSACSSSQFNLQATMPSGWTAAFANLTLILSPGASVSTTLTVTSPTSATNGFYDIGVTVTNSGAPSYTASGKVVYVIKARKRGGGGKPAK